ncbi:ribbon-helix-helix protein, CopG family [Chlorobaculum sp. MV4-Y]|uniref:CopG family ribbon-helix-helix protein n=1 Tax=Chlorobaculum sp. MV4-Y TaxID=2976335 RepID=UPI0021AF3C0C|nr:ribbon-helix-helix protein, CopG family [Chlorobaculum sp. MV4-Y]UWX56798.1 ribbon-helix-helix protein, CopG family [Chlorobaculum sp. MV4-Y]
MSKTKTKGVKLDDTTHKRLEELARIRDRSPHWLMCRAIETYLDREEKYEEEKREDMDRWERYQLTGIAVTHEKAAEWLENLAEGKVTACPR